MKNIQDQEFYKILTYDDIKMSINGIEYVEEWKDIDDYEGLFQVSSFGRIKSFPKIQNGFKGRIRKQLIDNRGYLRVSLGKNGEKKTYKVHRLVCDKFNGIATADKNEVNHLNVIKTCNHFLNLEWCTRNYNMRHAAENNRIPSKWGELNERSTLTNRQVMEIFNSSDKLLDAASKFNVSMYNISDIRRGKTWSKLTGKVYCPNNKKTAV